MSEKRPPQHLHMFNSRFTWDWRRENPVELVLLVFAMAFFFMMPRGGCGITDRATLAAQQASAASVPGDVGTAAQVPGDGSP